MAQQTEIPDGILLKALKIAEAAAILAMKTDDEDRWLMQATENVERLSRFLVIEPMDDRDDDVVLRAMEAYEAATAAREMSRWVDDQGYLLSEAPSSVVSRYFQFCTRTVRVQIPAIRPRETSPVQLEVVAAPEWPRQRSGQAAAPFFSSRQHQAAWRERAWETFVDIVGVPLYWPRFIYEAFNSGRHFDNYARMLVVHFAVLNGVAWDTLDECLYATMGRENYETRGRRAQCMARYNYFFTHSEEINHIHRARAFSYNVRERMLQILSHVPCDRHGHALSRAEIAALDAAREAQLATEEK